MQIHTDFRDVSRLGVCVERFRVAIAEAAFDEESEDSFDEWEFFVAVVVFNSQREFL